MKTAKCGAQKAPKKKDGRRALAVGTCSASGFWRSARGENHGRDSLPGDVWVEPGDITDTDRLNWLDAVMVNSNARNGTCYGWRYDINHNRAALTDNNIPALNIREAIDAAMRGPNT